MRATDETTVLGVERSALAQQWQARGNDLRGALAIAQRCGVSDIVGQVLSNRGITCDNAEAYLNPTIQADLPDPSVFADMDRAAARLADAIGANEQIALFGDYDVDGATSAALLNRFMRALGHSPILYIPDRMTEGYGPNSAALAQLAGRGVSLVLTLDCGISAFAALADGRRAGLDVVVLDHHQAEPVLPDAYAIVNPNRLDDRSGHGQLAAIGVVFLFTVAVNRLLRERGYYEAPDRHEPNLMRWLDLVALGTVCDVVPLTGVNRALVRQGLAVMARRGNAGLSALARIADIDEPPSAYHAGFVFGPRINAGGRVGRSEFGAQLLSTDDPAQAQTLAQQLDHYNSERRAIEMQVLDEAQEMAARQLADRPQAAALIVAARGWHPGVIGIVASRLKDRFHLPAIVIALDPEGEGTGKGSGRSVAGLDLGAAVTAAKQAGLLINGGGHKMAAGLTVAADKLPDLVAFLESRIGERSHDMPAARGIGIDAVLGLGAADSDLVELLEKAGPFGAGNPEPRFAFTNIRIIDSAIVGEKHVRCVFADDAGSKLQGISFNSADTELGTVLLKGMRAGKLHIAGKLRPNNWRGMRKVQLHIDDVANCL